MLSSRRSGSRSISDAWDSDTNAPEAGYSTEKATSRSHGVGAPAASARAPAKAAPPASTSVRRRQVTATTPRTGSTASDTKLGIARRSPISA